MPVSSTARDASSADTGLNRISLIHGSLSTLNSLSQCNDIISIMKQACSNNMVASTQGSTWERTFMLLAEQKERDR
jgi:hypothetical protein